MKRINIFLTIITILMLFILIFLLSLTYKHIHIYNSEINFYNSTLKIVNDNKDQPFSIDKIVYFSNCNANANTNSNSTFIISNLYQYTDIAIFINNYPEKGLTMNNTLKSVTLDNFNYKLKPSVGTPNLYFKNLNNFAKSDFLENNIINDSIKFDTTSENTLDYNKPILFNNCANPITLCYVNSDIKEEFALSSKISNISYNGSLLKTCGITLDSIACTVSLNVNITNNLDETYTCPITLNIPISDGQSTLYDGTLTVKESTNYNFIKKSVD